MSWQANSKRELNSRCYTLYLIVNKYLELEEYIDTLNRTNWIVPRVLRMKNGNSTYLDTGIQKEFQSIFQQLYCSEDVPLEAFIGFDDNLVTSWNEINTDLVDKPMKRLFDIYYQSKGKQVLKMSPNLKDMIKIKMKFKRWHHHRDCSIWMICSYSNTTDRRPLFSVS